MLMDLHSLQSKTANNLFMYVDTMFPTHLEIVWGLSIVLGVIWFTHSTQLFSEMV